MNVPTPLVTLLRIGELSRRSGRSIDTIRWYESVGVMPGVVRDTAGRRVYRSEHVDWLSLVERLRQTGMSIAQIAVYARLVRQGRSSLAARQMLLEAHRDRVKSTIASWNESLDLIERKIDFYGDWVASGKRPPLPAALKQTRSLPASTGGPSCAARASQAKKSGSFPP